MIINTWVEIFLSKPTSKEALYPPELELRELQEYLSNMQDEWYNIYQILNDFSDSRKIADLYWYNVLWFDIDSNELDLNWILEKSENLLWFKPAIVNKTYKWYHLFYVLEDDLYFMDVSYYENLHKLMNNYLEGDVWMKSTTGVLKIPGFFDKKDWREGYIIQNVYTNEEEILTKEFIERLTGMKMVLDLERENRIKIKAEKKKIRNYLLDGIDARELIQKINEEVEIGSSLFTRKIEVNWNNIDDSNGLLLEEENWLWMIKEFNHGKTGKRYWIWWFLMKYVFRDIENKKTGINWKDLNLFLYKNWNIGINIWTKNKTPVYTEYYYSMLKKNNIIIWTKIEDEFWTREEVNEVILSNIDKTHLKLLLMVIMRSSFDTKDNLSSWIMIKESDFLRKLWLSDNTEHRKELRKKLLLLSSLTFSHYEHTEKFSGIQYKHIYEFGILSSNEDGKTIYYQFKSNHPSSKIIFISNAISFFKKKEQKAFIIDLESEFQIYGSKIHYKLETVKDKLNISDISNVRKFFKKLKDNSIIKEYEILHNKTVYLYGLKYNESSEYSHKTLRINKEWTIIKGK